MSGSKTAPKARRTPAASAIDSEMEVGSGVIGAFAGGVAESIRRACALPRPACGRYTPPRSPEHRHAGPARCGGGLTAVGTTRLAKLLRRIAVVSWRAQPSQSDIEALQANIRRVGLVVRVRWAIVIALTVFSVFAAWVYAVATPLATLLRNMAIPAVALAFVCVYNAYFQMTYRRWGNVRFFNHAQLFLDTVVVTVLVYYSGGVYSWFHAMYLLFVLEAAFILPGRGDVWAIAAFSSVCYGGVLLTEYLRWVPHVVVPFSGNDLFSEHTYVLVRYLWVVTIQAGAASVATLMMGAVRARELDLGRRTVVDSLTGLYNRSYCQRLFETEIERAAADGRRVGVVVADLDDLTAFNKLFGVDAGDQLLAQVATEIERSMRDAAPGVRAAVCRFGGEEFAIILPEDTPGGRWTAAEVAEAVRAAVARVRVGDGGVTASVGYAEHPRDGVTAGDLLVAADGGLAAAQAAGGNAARGPVDDAGRHETAEVSDAP
ncbi:MAG: GGDEF domain-containing protein [Actinobacteria bacterium]|nr:MAG: GGDEF domain-containing protein [Actinomycetota bacterium]